MIAALALLALLLVCYILTTSVPGALVLAAVILFALWTVEPFGNRFELRIALANWRDRLGLGP